MHILLTLIFTLPSFFSPFIPLIRFYSVFLKACGREGRQWRAKVLTEATTNVGLHFSCVTKINKPLLNSDLNATSSRIYSHCVFQFNVSCQCNIAREDLFIN